MSIEKPTLRTPEQKQERQEKRKKLRKLLPADLQLEFVHNRPEKDKWEMDGKLMKLRQSQEQQDKLFIEAVKLISKIDTKEFKQIEELFKKEKQEITQELETIILYEQGIKDSDWGVRYGTAQSLGELAKIAPERYIPLYEQGIKDSDWGVRRGTAQSLGELAKINNFQRKKVISRIIFKEHKMPENELLYVYKTIVNLLENDQDLGIFKKEYLPVYLSIKKLAEQVNSSIEESKKWQDVEAFFNKHQIDIVNLQSIDLKLSTQLLTNLVSRGLSFTEGYLEIFSKTLNNQEVKQAISTYVKQNKSLDGYNLIDLLEISSAYMVLNEQQKLTEILQSQTKNFNQLKTILNRSLLEQTAKGLDLQAEVSDQELSRWKLKYFANLLTNKELMKSKDMEDALKLYEAMLKATFEDRFDDFISNEDQQDEIGETIAKHNQKVEKEFKRLSVNWDKWLSFSEQVKMEVGTQKKQNQEGLFNQFEQRFKTWQESITEKTLKDSLNKDLTQLNQKKKEFDITKININDPKWIELLLPSYTKTLNYLKTKNKDFKSNSESEEAFGHLLETIKSLTQEQQKEQAVKKEFRVKLWDRDPRKDLFQGNATHCCIAVGVKETPPGGGLTTHHPETIIQYLVDKGINVAEIIDPDTGDVIAQTWLFVTLNRDNRPILVADNFEVNNRYPAGNNVNRGIREAMFEFLNKYAKSCNIKKVVLGHVGTNDVETNDLTKISLPKVEKVGGYLEDEEYYLEALGDTDAWEVK